VTAKLTDLPSKLAEAVRVARADLPEITVHGRPEPVITDPALREWIQEFTASGELAAAIQDIAANDPDLV
jgi:hypothetical protein